VRPHVGLSLLLVVTVAACSGGSRNTGHPPSSRAPPPSGPVPTPLEYMTEVTATVKEHGYYADRVDWADWDASLTDAAARADDPSDTYGVVRGLLARLDPHSGFESPAVARSLSVLPERLPEREQPAGGVLTMPHPPGTRRIVWGLGMSAWRGRS